MEIFLPWQGNCLIYRLGTPDCCQNFWNIFEISSRILMGRQYIFFFNQQIENQPLPACISINGYPHGALGSADSPYHGRTQNFPWSVVLYHPLFPSPPSSVISFPQTLLSDSHSSPLLLHKFFMCYISFSVGLSTKLPNKQFDFHIPLFFSQHAHYFAT